MSTQREYVVFKLDNEYYGLRIQVVENIEKMPLITRVPFTKPYLTGIINLRGVVIPIVNLRSRFGLSEAAHDEDTRIIIVSSGDIKVGLIVDASSETLQLSEDEIDVSPTIKSAVDEKFIREIGKKDNRIIMLLDLQKVLGLEDEE